MNKERSYHFRMALTPGIWYEGELDFTEGRQHFEVGLTGQSRSGEIYWLGPKGMGHLIGTNFWMKLTGQPMVDIRRSVFDFLVQGPVVSSREEGEYWRVDFGTIPPPHLEDSERIVRNMARSGCCGDEQAFMRRFAEIRGSSQIRVFVTISRRDFSIAGLTTEYTGPNRSIRMDVSFSSPKASIPALPGEASTASIEGPMDMLVFHLPTLGGWVDIQTHPVWS